MEEHSASVSQKSLFRVLERRGEDESSARRQSLLSDAAGTETRGLVSDSVLSCSTRVL